MHGVAPTKRDARGSTQDRVALRHKSAGPRWSTVRMQGRNVFIEFVPPNEKRSRRRRKKAAAAAAAAAKAGTEILSPVMDPPDIVPTVAPKKRCVQHQHLQKTLVHAIANPCTAVGVSQVWAVREGVYSSKPAWRSDSRSM